MYFPYMLPKIDLHKTSFSLKTLGIIVVSALLLLIQNLKAQNTQMVSFSLGAAKPLGKFKDNSPYGNTDGCAILGGYAEVSYRHKIYKFLFAEGMLRSQANPLKKGEYVNYSATTFKGPFFCHSAQVGVLGMLQLSKSVFLEGKILAGPTLGVHPENRIKMYNDHTSTGQPSEYESQQDRASAFALAYLAGIGMRSSLSQQWCLKIDLSYYATRLHFSDVKGHNITGGFTFTESFDRSVKTVSLGLGLGYIFEK